jgi:hypothetical protein
MSRRDRLLSIYSAVTRITAASLTFGIALMAWIGAPLSMLDVEAFALLLFAVSLLLLVDGVRFLVARP